MSDRPTPNTPDRTPGLPGVSFDRSSEGFAVARVGDHAFAMLPGHAGRHYLATGWKIGRPPSEWRGADFHGHSGELADEAAFRAHVLEQAEHQREKQALGRRNVATHVHTPWGSAQHSTHYAEGVEFHSTASHGGFKLSSDRNRMVHALLRSDNGFYEEDCAWAAVAITFPELFTSFENYLNSQVVSPTFHRVQACHPAFSVLVGALQQRANLNVLRAQILPITLLPLQGDLREVRFA